MPKRHDRRRVRDPRTSSARDDDVAIEEPLEIRIAGDPVAVTMRTPGDDLDLALGFLFAEGIIGSASDVGSVAHCGRPGQEGYGNVVEVTPAPGVALAIERVQATRRGTLTTSACGVCGRRTVEDLMRSCGRLVDGPAMSAGRVALAVEGLREAQDLFTRTGGTHGAAAYDAWGRRLLVREDVGRHNAVDKVVGGLLRQGRAGEGAPGAGVAAVGGGGRDTSSRDAPTLLVVSGRASFEMVQKAVRAGIPILASVSAPTTLAIDLALDANLTLAGFVRGTKLNVYAHPERLAEAPAREGVQRADPFGAEEQEHA